MGKFLASVTDNSIRRESDNYQVEKISRRAHTDIQRNNYNCYE